MSYPVTLLYDASSAGNITDSSIISAALRKEGVPFLSEPSGDGNVHLKIQNLNYAPRYFSKHARKLIEMAKESVRAEGSRGMDSLLEHPL